MDFQDGKTKGYGETGVVTGGDNIYHENGDVGTSDRKVIREDFCREVEIDYIVPGLNCSSKTVSSSNNTTTITLNTPDIYTWRSWFWPLSYGGKPGSSTFFCYSQSRRWYCRKGYVYKALTTFYYRYFTEGYPSTGTAAGMY